MTAEIIKDIVALLGLIAIFAGCFMVFGLGVALIVVGVMLVGISLLSVIKQ